MESLGRVLDVIRSVARRLKEGIMDYRAVDSLFGGESRQLRQ